MRILEKISFAVQNTIKETPSLNKKQKILQSVQGIGPECTAVLIAEVPEFGMVGRQQIAAMIGLASINRDSGSKKGHAFIQAGRKYVRCALYMLTLVAATHWNPILKKYYDRLVAAGKPKKVVLTACMRKMLVYLNSLIAKNI